MFPTQQPIGYASGAFPAGLPMKACDARYEKPILLAVGDPMRGSNLSGRRCEDSQAHEYRRRTAKTCRRAPSGDASVRGSINFPIAGFGLFPDFAHTQWPVTRMGIDQEIVFRRLHESERSYQAEFDPIGPDLSALRPAF